MTVPWRQLPLIALAGVLLIPPAQFVLVRANRHEVDRTTAAWKAREALIARARVFTPGPTEPDALEAASTIPEINCHYAPKAISGTTAKFDCRLDSGETIKVKYGWSRERYGEVAATQLLHALGFGADRVAMAQHVRCYGCPRWPFEQRRLAEQFLMAPLLDYATNDRRAREFEWVSVEHKAKGREIEVDDFEGWDWRELDLVDPAKGGASRAELDALRLIAVFLAHWDNKNTNQRLICVDAQSRRPESDDTCPVPMLILQDLGATFGPSKVRHEEWSTLPIWTDAPTCLVSMETLPYDGVLFGRVHISEEGRALLASRLQRLSRADIQRLFENARFPEPGTRDSPAKDLTPWVDAFERKVREIADRPPCPR